MRLSFKVPKRISCWAALATLGGLSMAACGHAPQFSDFRVGMTRERVVATFGEPQRRQSLVKSGPSIWGPVETFWTSVPRGARVEIWSYPISGGTVELYFVEDSAEVRGTAFSPQGAVY